MKNHLSKLREDKPPFPVLNLYCELSKLIGEVPYHNEPTSKTWRNPYVSIKNYCGSLIQIVTSRTSGHISYQIC